MYDVNSEEGIVVAEKIKRNVLIFIFSSFDCTVKIPQFHLISWCGSFLERHSFRIVSGESPKTMWKLCLSTKFPHQEIRWNYGILRSVDYFNFKLHRFWNLSIYNKHHYIFFQHQGGFRGFRIVIIITHPCNRLLLKKLLKIQQKLTHMTCLGNLKKLNSNKL